jgi:geranylgeranyl pyrophosphate synthase
MTRLPDNPLTEELEKLYNIFTHYYPIEEYPHLYHAAESMYIAQNRDMQLTMEKTEKSDLKDIYPDVLIKSGMTRVVANIIARRNIDPDFYRRCLNSMVVHQFRDDLKDFNEDFEAKRITTFTHPNSNGSTNPLYDMFAFDAYIGALIYHHTTDILARSQATFLSHHLFSHPNQVHELLNRYRKNTPESLRQFILQASELPESVVNKLVTVDQKIKKTVNEYTAVRNQVDIDPRTFVWDRVQTINEIISQFINNQKIEENGNELVEIMKYSLEAGGKHLRPALTLMLAESLGVNPTNITPLLLASELFHTSSLLLDDLPWQDNSTTRRGKPTAHTVYDASSAELTGIHMLLEGVSVLQELQKHYPPADIVAITNYTAKVIQDISRGQNMDLHMKKEEASVDNIILMYHLKTAVAIEASLVPLMMLQKRPPEEIVFIKQYAHHSGLVFQMRDDLLDAQSNTEALGKDVRQDVNKINIVQIYGRDKTIELMEFHLEQALIACKNLPFNTNLLQGIAKYFATRKK